MHYPKCYPNNRIYEENVNLQKTHATAESMLATRVVPMPRASLPSVFWMIHLNAQKFEYISESYEIVWGRSRKNLYHNPGLFLETIHVADREMVTAALNQRPNGGAVLELEYRIVRPDRSVRWILNRYSAVDWPDDQTYAGVALDITDRKAAEHALSHHNAVFKFSAVATIGTDLEGVVATWNEAAEHLFGYAAVEAIGGSIMRIVPMERADEEGDILNRIVRGEKIAPMETVRRHQDGHLLDVTLAASPLRDAAGKITGAVMSYRDIVKAKRRNPGILEGEQLSATAFEMSKIGMAHVALDGMLLWVNHELCRLTANSRAELLLRTLADITYADDRAVDGDQLRSLVEGRLSSFTVEKRLVRMGGSPVWVESTASLVRARDGSPRCLYVEMRDVTTQRDLETQLWRAQRMEPIGHLALGVAHDFNNVLAFVTMRAELTGTDQSLPLHVRADLEQIKMTAMNASHLTRQLLMCGRNDTLTQPQYTNLNILVKGTARMLQRLVGEDIALDLELHGSALSVHIDPGVVDQILLNLAANARDAMPDGGSLRIETHEVTFTVADRLPPNSRPGTFACLKIADTGAGIPAELLPRIFEPFFTTKRPGKGTGLGLAMVSRAVKQSRGWIEVESASGQGTIFRIYLPITVPEDTAVALAAAGEMSFPQGSETVLLVEDESSVRFTARALLERQGYKIYEATNGVHALEMWDEHGDEIALVITDMVLPGGISGRDLVGQLSIRKPDLKVIFTTGYSPDMVGSHLTLREGYNFLAKPWSVDRLLGAVQQMLPATASPAA